MFLYLLTKNSIHSIQQDGVPEIRIFLPIIMGWGEQFSSGACCRNIFPVPVRLCFETQCKHEIK